MLLLQHLHVVRELVQLLLQQLDVVRQLVEMLC